MAFFRPDRYLARLTQLDVRRDILQAGYTGLLLDVDNTLLPRDGSGVPEDIRAWVEDARAAGLKICLTSNNWHQPVLDLAAEWGLPLVYGCVKPLPFGFWAGRRRLGTSRKATLCVGDQLITDVWGAHLSGVRAWLLDPLVTEDLWHTLALRRLQRVILRNIQPEQPEKENCHE